MLEFDKNEVLVDALGGDLANPVWMYSATFDVSRISDIAITAYLRTQAPKHPAAGDDGNDDMGNSDLALGAIRFTPDLETGKMLDEWVPIAGGTGSVHVQVAFKPAQVCLFLRMDGARSSQVGGWVRIRRHGIESRCDTESSGDGTPLWKKSAGKLRGRRLRLATKMDSARRSDAL